MPCRALLWGSGAGIALECIRIVTVYVKLSSNEATDGMADDRGKVNALERTEYRRLADDFGWHIESLADARGGWWVIAGERPPSTFDEEILDELADVVDGS